MATDLEAPPQEEDRAPDSGGPSPKPKRGTAIALLAGLIGAVVGSTATILFAGNDPAPVVQVARGAARGSLSLSGVGDVARAVLPSVVRIDTTGRQSGTGSGVIFRSDGYIITNDHVTSGARAIEVTLSTGETLPARLIGSAQPSDDIAVIKVEKTGLTPATIGSTNGLSVGDMAVAIGSPFGLSGSVTAGVVSALHRNIDFGGGARITDAIQTDAPINPGNSGGALANARGEVIGINAAAVGAAVGGSVGVGFAIPIDIARKEAEQIIETGRASRPFIGIAGESVPNEGGALVAEVVAGGPAAQAGLRAGDVIIELDGRKIPSMEALITELTQRNVDETVAITYRRNGETHRTDVKLSVRGE